MFRQSISNFVLASNNIMQEFYQKNLRSAEAEKVIQELQAQVSAGRSSQFKSDIAKSYARKSDLDLASMLGRSGKPFRREGRSISKKIPF